MGQAIKNEDDPVDAHLESVLPGVYRWHTATHNAVQCLTTQVGDLKKDVCQGFSDIKKAHEDQREESDRRLAATFMEVATLLVKGGSASLQGLRTLKEREGSVNSEEEGAPNDNADPTSSYHTFYHLTPRHKLLADMWDEWFGFNRFNDGFGGVHGRDKKYKAKWRKHIDSQHHSRTKRCILGTQECAREHQMNEQEALAELQSMCEEEKNSVANLVQRFQHDGLLSKKSSRGKSKLIH